MEECDALCTKMVIMVNGRFVCCGSSQHLKNKFGQGYTLICNMGNDEDGGRASAVPLKQYLCHKFPSTKIFDDHQGYCHFQIMDMLWKMSRKSSTWKTMLYIKLH